MTTPVPPEAVEAAMKTFGCKPYDGVWNALAAPICDQHFEEVWTEWGCPVAYNVASDVVAALDLPAREREAAAKTLEDAADGIQALHPGEVKNSVVWLRARASALREGGQP